MRQNYNYYKKRLLGALDPINKYNKKRFCKSKSYVTTANDQTGIKKLVKLF